MLKDHLGNVRMVLTDEVKSDNYFHLSFEGAPNSQEVSNQREIWEDANGNAFDVIGKRTSVQQLVNATTLIPPTFANSLLVRSSTGKVGAAKLFKVMSGDKIHTTVQYYFSQNTESGNTNSLNTLVSGLVNALANSIGSTAAIKANPAAITNPLSIDPNAIGFFSPQNSTTNNGRPKAFLNVLFFDEQFKFDNTNSYSEQISTTNPGQIVIALGSAREAKKNGYCYIYISNETNDMVYFDNFTLKHERGPILEETHYYPFGLTMAGISSQAAGSLENKRKFNKGSELQSKEFSDGSGLELYATNFRSLDPQLGRWWQIDPKASESESPYASMSNNPIRFNDPLGDTIVDAQIKADKNWGKAYNTWLSSKAGKRFVKLYSPGGKYGTTTVVFKTGKTNQDNSAQGNTKAFSINRKDGSSTELTPDKRYGGIDKVASGQSKDNYLKFEVTLREGDDMNSPTGQVEGGEAVLHETQHVRADQQTLITDKAIISPYLIHRDFMKPATSQAYQERYGFYIENKQMWQADYDRQKSQGKVTSESDYINKKINDFRN